MRSEIGPETNSIVDVNVVCYGEVREVVGRKHLDCELSPDATVEDLLAVLSGEFPALDPDDVGRASLVVSKDGRNVRHLDGADTTLEAGCVVSLSGSVVAE